MDFGPHRNAICVFLGKARESGVTDAGTHHELIRFLDVRTGAWGERDHPPPPRDAPQARHARPTEPMGHGPGRSQQRAAAPVHGPDPEPKPRQQTLRTPVEPPPPPEPGELSRRISAVRRTVLSDLSIHGFAYLGVLVIFACVLGLLLFAFADIPDSHQPFYELVIALVFFAFAWYLRRQGAAYVAKAMELIGGMALPLVVFAGLVDNAPIPPDFQETGLVVALTTTAFVLSALYAYWSARHAISMLGYLVAPLRWLAALTLGFGFKGDEPLVGDAITRLVSHQPALAAAAVAISMASVGARPRARLARATRAAGFVGAPVAYLLTLTLAAGEDWTYSTPLLLAGAATFISVELLIRSLERSEWLVNVRPFLVAMLIVPLFPDLGAASVGVLVVVAYTALFEWTARSTPSETPALGLARVGIGLGAVLSLGDGITSLVAFTLITCWAHFRRIRPIGDEPELLLTVTAALAPVGIGFGLTQVVAGTAAWAIMSAIVVVIGVSIRMTRVTDDVWALWPTGAALAIAHGVNGVAAPAPDHWRIAAMVGVALVLAIGTRHETARLWAAATTMSLVAGEASRYFADPDIGRSMMFGAVGLTLVAVASLTLVPRRAHLAGIGHVFSAAAFIAPHDESSLAAVAAVWTLGWALSTLASQKDDESLTAVLGTYLGDGAASIAPAITAASLPLTTILALELWPAYSAEAAWIGATLGVLAVCYGVMTRALATRGVLARVAGTGGVTLAVAAPLFAAPDRLAAIVALAAGVAVPFLVAKTLRSDLIDSYGWLAGHGLVLLLAEQVGVPTRDLDRVALILGATTIVVSLLADDRIGGRRAPGQVMRAPSLANPSRIGALTTVVSTIALIVGLPETSWWVVAAGTATVAIAYLLRTGLLSAPGLLLMAIGLVSLDTDYWLDEPWHLVLLATPMVGLSIVAFLRQPDDVASDDSLRWDLAPLMVAHIFGGVALALAPIADDVVATAIAFGLLSLALGAVHRNRMWLEAGNALLVVAALDAGSGWLTLVLASTAVRGAVAAYYSEGRARLTNHVVGAVAGGLAWFSLLGWQETTLPTAIEASAITGAAFTLVVVVAGRIGFARHDSTRAWGSVGLLLAAWATLSASLLPDGPPGPVLGSCVLVVAATLELSHRQTDRSARYLAAPTTLLGWLLLVAGLELSAPISTGAATLVFGLIGLFVAEATRRYGRNETRDVSLVWGVLASLVVVVSTFGVVGLDDRTAGYLASAGVAALGLGAARAAAPLVMPFLRGAATLVWLAAVMTLAWTARWPAESVAVAMALVGATATLGYLALWVRGRAANWKGPLTSMAIAGNVIAGALALYAWPARGLSVAISLSLAAQALAIGLYRARPALLSMAPPLTASAFFLAVGEGLDRHPLWYTLPLGVVTLSELEILRHVRRYSGKDTDNPGTLTVEVLGLGLMVMPPLVTMFGGGLAYAGLALLVAMACLIWAGVTRVRRRVISAGAVALATTVLALVAAAADGAPDSVAFWVTGAGIGIAVMLVAGFVEAYRSKKGRLMVQLDRLMDEWE